MVVDSPSDRGPYGKYLRELGLIETVAKDLHDRYIQNEFEPRISSVPNVKRMRAEEAAKNRSR